jgi:broad-specificity NMP kinase
MIDYNTIKELRDEFNLTKINNLVIDTTDLSIKEMADNIIGIINQNP